jgi:hypothetical protein
VAELTAQQAGEILRTALADLGQKAEITVADAAAKAGMPLRSAELGLRWLSSQYRGTLSVTDQGELLHRFPYGFSLPLTKKSWWQKATGAIKNAALGVGRFIIRGWVTIVMVGYALFFLALAIAMAVGGRDERGFTPVYLILRVLTEALWWMFHPFSPVARRNIYDDSWLDGSDDRDDTTPFYEKVNRFVFGPPQQHDPRERERRLIAAIRHGHGRIGLLDALRVTGLSREELDPLLSRLMLDYDGDVHVNDDGAITYSFPQLQKTTTKQHTKAPRAIWEDKITPPPVTGNETGTNLWVMAINGFNLVMSLVALKMNMTLDRAIDFFMHVRDRLPHVPLPYDGTPWLFGVIPFAFSLLMFGLPLYRWATTANRAQAAAKENAQRALLKTLYMELHSAEGGSQGIREDRLKAAWRSATGKDPEEAELSRELAKLGADVDMEALAEGRGLYRFRDLEAEVKALESQREEAAKKQEHEVGEVVFRA